MAENGSAEKSGGMGESTPYRLFRAMQEIAGLTKDQVDDLILHHQSLIRRLGESYLSRSNALPSTSTEGLSSVGHSAEQTQPV